MARKHQDDTMTTTTTIINGREFVCTEVDMKALSHLRGMLISNGWEGQVWLGVSDPVGRQRKTITAHIWRNAKSGKMSIANAA